MPIIQTQNLLKRFNGVKAVDNFSAEIEKGKVTGIIGPNGSGKTTLINLLSGVLKFNEGFIIVNGVKLSRIRRYEIPFYGITRTFQEIRLFEQMPVLDNILVEKKKKNIFSSLLEKHKELHLKKAEEVLRKIRLWEKRNDLALNLSYGQRKLLEIARATAMNAEIYLLDEPFAGLYPEMRKIISEIIKELRQEGKTIILIEHNMDLIRELCDNLIVMDAGKLFAQGNPNEVLNKKEVLQAYLGE
ncbi:ABC transporter ATP-binding protein [Candidatus Wolfebacteria bacterium]|nr:ABC transporter ATP-binding protein [Candidatus Wolfebacteria bacterium]